MKETYYKLNREKLEDTEDYTYLKRKIGYLVNRGILEEVQEEELKEQIKLEKLIAISEEGKLLEEIRREKEAKEESKQAIDNMFGNPLEQIDSMIDGTKPFLNGMTPSIWLENTSCDYQKSLIIDDARWHATTLFIDILVEELKRKGSL